MRSQAVLTIVQLIKRNCAGDCECDILSELMKLKVSSSYLVRMKLLQVIEKTMDCGNQKYTGEYKKILSNLLTDNIPNIKLKIVKILSENRKMMDKVLEAQIDKLKEDPDMEVQRAAKQIKL